MAKLIKDDPVELVDLRFIEIAHDLQAILPQSLFQEVVRHRDFRPKQCDTFATSSFACIGNAVADMDKRLSVAG